MVYGQILPETKEPSLSTSLLVSVLSCNVRSVAYSEAVDAAPIQWYCKMPKLYLTFPNKISHTKLISRYMRRWNRLERETGIWQKLVSSWARWLLSLGWLGSPPPTSWSWLGWPLPVAADHFLSHGTLVASVEWSEDSDQHSLSAGTVIHCQLSGPASWYCRLLYFCW